MSFDAADILELFAEAQGTATEFFTGVRVITRVGRGEPVKMDAAYFRAWRAANPEKSRAIARAYYERKSAENREEFLAAKRASNRRHYEKHRDFYQARARAQHAAKKAVAP